MDFTTDPQRRSFLDIPRDSDFPIQNLPYGIFRCEGRTARAGVAIGDQVLDLAALAERGFLAEIPSAATLFASPTLNDFMAAGPATWRRIRETISRLLAESDPRLRDNSEVRERVLLPMANVRMELPATIGDYTDFYSSKEHATNVGIMMRGKENALMPNWVHIPIGYHGRSSSVVLSGTPVRRPMGQSKAEDAALPSFGPSRRLDFELEMGFFMGPGNSQGETIPVERAEDRIFGVVLVNDWSARDVQAWEYQPLGPFLAKNFATSISPWIVPIEALEPFRCEGPVQDPQPLPYLRTSGAHAFDINLEIAIATAVGRDAHRVCRTNFRHMYWNMAQQLAHHASGGCNMRPGDLLASGTISGPEPDSYGSMLELAWKGTKPVAVGEETRTFLNDGDTVIMRGWCERDGVRIGFGECRGEVLPAVT